MTQSSALQSHTPPDYMHGLSTPFAEMLDASLFVEGTSLPVHRAILAASSTVFAELFNCASTEKPMPALEFSAFRQALISSSCQTSSSTQLQVPLPEDKIWDVCTALKFLFMFKHKNVMEAVESWLKMLMSCKLLLCGKHSQHSASAALIS